MKNKEFIPEWQFPSEFLSDGDMHQLFMKHNLMSGRMISGSKSGYRDSYPDHIVFFNANIIIPSRGKVWYGDLAFPPDTDKIQNICNELKEPLYILYEMDARFENENRPIEFYKNKAKMVFNPQL